MRGVLWSIETGNLPALWEQLQSGLTIRGASPNTIARHRMHIGRLDQFMRRRGMTYYSPEIGAMFMNDDIPNDEPSTFENNRGTITQLNLVFNGKEITAKGRTFNPEVFIGPLAPIFQKFCETVCPTDVSEMKLYEYTRYGAEFLSYAVSNGAQSVSDITPSLLTHAFQHCSSKKAFTTVVRRLMRFLYEQNLMDTDYSILVPKERQAQPIPSVYNEEEITALLSVPDRNTAIGKRNYALMMLAWRLGFRAGDIANLQFSHIDLKTNKISFIQGKTDFPITTELVPEVKKAIIDYIKNGRPDSSSPYVFLSSRKGNSPITASCITAVVGRSFRRAHLLKQNKKHGPHSLRSSFASELVAEGVPYTTVHKVLGQQKASNLSYYIQVDIEHLRECALEVPPATLLFKQWLEVHA